MVVAVVTPTIVDDTFFQMHWVEIPMCVEWVTYLMRCETEICVYSCNVSCSCLIPNTRFTICVMFVFDKSIPCKFVSNPHTRHINTIVMSTLYLLST